jgi:hypothetical protein
VGKNQETGAVLRFSDENTGGEDLIPGCNQSVAQAFQPVSAQAKACGYKNIHWNVELV